MGGRDAPGEDLEAQRRRLSAALGSGDAGRVAAALAELDERWQRGVHVELPVPAVDVLAAFGADVPPEVVATYLRVLRDYVAFHPAPEPGELRAWALEAVLAHGAGLGGLQLSLDVATDPDPAAAAAAMVHAIAARGLHDDRELLAAQRLVSYLLDAERTRAATLAALRAWPPDPRLDQVIEYAVPQLEPGELARLRAGPAGRDG